MGDLRDWNGDLVYRNRDPSRPRFSRSPSRFGFWHSDNKVLTLRLVHADCTFSSDLVNLAPRAKGQLSQR